MVWLPAIMVTNMAVKCIELTLLFSCLSCYRFISRVKRMLQGSSDDIGWLQRSEQFPPMEDGTTHFMELLHDVRHVVSATRQSKFVQSCISHACDLFWFMDLYC